MMRVLKTRLFWFCQILIMLQSVCCKHHWDQAAARHGNNTTIVRRDTAALSNVEALYNTYKSSTKSEITYYGIYPGGGACALDPLSPMAKQDGWIRVAAGKADFQNSLGCGMCVEITGSGKGSGSSPLTGTAKAIVHDLCGGCKKGGFDLFIAGDGRWEVTSRSIDCPTLQGPQGNIMFRFTGSNPWYIKLQARNVKIPAAGIEVLHNGKYSCLKRTSDNYFTGHGRGKVQLPMKVRVTSISGEQLEAILPSITNDQNTPSNIQFGGISKGRGPTDIKCFGQGNKSPYPAGGMSPSEEAGSSVGRPSTTGPGNRVPTEPPKGEGSSGTGRPSGGTVNKGGDFCERRESGVHPDPDDCQGFILCDAGKTYRKKCAEGLLFNPKNLVCAWPQRVKCRPPRAGSKDRGLGEAEKRGELAAFAGKPAVEIVIQKEKAQETAHKAPNTEGIQAIRPNEEFNAGAENVSKDKEDGGHTNESRISSLGQRPAGLTNTTTGANSSEDRRKTSKDEGSFVTVMNENNTSSHNSGHASSHKGGHGSTISEVLAGRIGRKAEENGDGQDTTPFAGVNVSELKGSGAPVRGTTNVSAATSQSVILTELPHDKFGNKNTSQHSHAADTSIAPTQPGTANSVPLTKEGSVGSLQPGTQNQQELNKGSAQVPSQQGTLHVPLKIKMPSQQQKLGMSSPEGPSHQGTAQPNALASIDTSAGVLSGEEGKAKLDLNSNESGVGVMTLKGLKTTKPSKPAVSREKETPAAPLVGITIKQTGQPDKYVLLNKRHELRTKHRTAAHE